MFRCPINPTAQLRVHTHWSCVPPLSPMARNPLRTWPPTSVHCVSGPPVIHRRAKLPATTPVPISTGTFAPNGTGTRSRRWIRGMGQTTLLTTRREPTERRRVLNGRTAMTNALRSLSVGDTDPRPGLCIGDACVNALEETSNLRRLQVDKVAHQRECLWKKTSRSWS